VNSLSSASGSGDGDNNSDLKHKTYKPFSKTNFMDVVKALQILGLNRLEATVLAYLLKKREAYVIDIEKGTGLRQPEVSLGLRGLKARGAVELKDGMKVNRGRPRKIAVLKTVEPILKMVEARKDEILEAYRVASEALKELEEVDSDDFTQDSED